MRTFVLHIEDVRQASPTLVFAEADDALGVGAIATRQFERSSHYVAVNIFEGGDLVQRIDRDAVLQA